jgi:hypothetical protein
MAGVMIPVGITKPTLLIRAIRSAAVASFIGCMLCSCAGSKSGYFYISAESVDCANVKKAQARSMENSSREDYVRPTVHGPFFTNHKARRALREQRFNDSCAVYYTRIFRM